MDFKWFLVGFAGVLTFIFGLVGLWYWALAGMGNEVGTAWLVTFVGLGGVTMFTAVWADSSD